MCMGIGVRRGMVWGTSMDMGMGRASGWELHRTKDVTATGMGTETGMGIGVGMETDMGQGW